DPDRATPAADALAIRLPREGSNTTHYSVVDSRGNAVSNTYTLNFPYGVGLVADGTGVLLNNELDDFTAAPGASNAFGLVGFEANLPGAGKRPLSSMSPTIVLKDGKPVLITGSPGGSRIISTVLQVIVNALDYQMDIAAAVAAPRLHHQWLPDEVRIERGFAADAIAALKAMGHVVTEPLGQTSANSIAVTPGGLLGAPDARNRGAASETEGHHLYRRRRGPRRRRQGAADPVRHSRGGPGDIGGGSDRGRIRRHRHLRQQCQRHQPHQYADDRHEALRFDDGHQ